MLPPSNPEHTPPPTTAPPKGYWPRDNDTGTLNTMLVPTAGLGTGVLHPHRHVGKFHTDRFVPSADLAPHIDVFWTVSWQLNDAPFKQYTLPHACVHVVLEDQRAEVVGVMRGRFMRVLEGHGRVFGVKFRPAMFRPWLDQPSSTITNQRLGLQQLLPVDDTKLAQAVLSQSSTTAMAARYAAFWQTRVPPLDVRACWVRDLVDYVEQHRHITHVAQLAAYANVSPRHLQRVFRNYIGTSPKWVIQRYRLIEAADTLARNGQTGAETQTQLALRLGFSDQAHFVRTFRTLVGTTPAAYAKANQPAPAS